MRLDRYIASVTDLSRKDVKRHLKDAAVTVNGECVRDPAYQVVDADVVELDGQNLRAPGHRYFMLHKPEGYVCADKDRLHATVFELMFEDNMERLHVAGRLDIDTTGLVLVSDDGQWIHRVTSPNSECFKRYRLRTADPIDERLVHRFAEGVYLGEEKRRTLPARLELLGDCEALLSIQEGRYHQVKRMFGASGNRVVALHREAIGGLLLDTELEEGEYRALSEIEIQACLEPDAGDQ